MTQNERLTRALVELCEPDKAELFCPEDVEHVFMRHRKALGVQRIRPGRVMRIAERVYSQLHPAVWVIEHRFGSHSRWRRRWTTYGQPAVRAKV